MKHKQHTRTLCAGIDAGSRALKIVILNADTHAVTASAIEDQALAPDAQAARLFERMLSETGCTRVDVARIVATGYARNAISIADATITEITCHACGVHHVAPQARTVIEIGGQDSKLLRLNDDGSVYDFAMNDRCAAGTGRFLEVVAQRLGIALSDLGPLARHSVAPAAISSMCIVFAETEIIGLLAAGVAACDIVAGVQRSIAARVTAMIGRSVSEPVVFTGGVALVPGMAKALAETLGHPIHVSPQPQFTGALGAALLAARQWHTA